MSKQELPFHPIHPASDKLHAFELQRFSDIAQQISALMDAYDAGQLEPDEYRTQRNDIITQYQLRNMSRLYDCI